MPISSPSAAMAASRSSIRPKPSSASAARQVEAAADGMQCPTGTFEFEAGGVYTELQCGFYIDQQIEDNDLHYLPLTLPPLSAHACVRLSDGASPMRQGSLPLPARGERAGVRGHLLEALPPSLVGARPTPSRKVPHNRAMCAKK